MFPPDYHLHTPLCRHATGSPSTYARHAVSVGLNEIGFSDHSPMARDDFDDWRMRLNQLDEYVESVRQARADVPQLQIRLALEVDYLPGQEDWIRDLASRHPWDYLIGSVHYISNGWDIDNPHKISLWQTRPTQEVWAEYFDSLTRAAASGLFDIIGHIDLPKKFGFIPDQDPTPLVRPVLKAAAQAGCAIELNTAGLRKECREIYPSHHILRLAREAGVPITFGSDAHAPEEVGLNFPEALQLARDTGYQEFCRFEQRRPHRAPLPK